jgi:hypothetical protein
MFWPRRCLMSRKTLPSGSKDVKKVPEKIKKEGYCRESAAMDRPNRRTIENLFSDLLRNRLLEEHSSLHEEYKQLQREEDALEEYLLDNPKLKRIKKRRSEAWDKWYRFEREYRKRAVELKMEYQVKGLTPDVQSKMLKFIEDIKSCH